MKIYKEYISIVMIILVVGLSFLYWYVEISNRIGFLYSTDDSSYKLEVENYNLKLYSLNENEISEKEIKYLKSLGINFLIGPNYSENGLRIYPYLEKYDMISFSPTISSDELLTLTERIFSLTPSNEMQISAIVKFLQDEKVSNVLLILDPFNRTYSDEYLRILNYIKGDYIYYYNLNAILKNNLNIRNYDAILITTNSSKAADIISFIGSDFEGIFILADSAIDIGLEKLNVNKNKIFFVSFTKNPFNATLELNYETLDLVSSHKFISTQQALRFFTGNTYYFNEKRTLNREIRIVNLSDIQGD